MFTALGAGGLTSGLPHVCTPVGCVATAEVVRGVMLAGSAAFAVAVLALVGNIIDARDACRQERERLVAEVTAFRRFARRVDRMDAAALTRATTDGGRNVDPSRPSTSTDGTDLRAVRSAYRETVMAVEHYQTHYGTPLSEHVAEEFGPDVATAIISGETLTSALKRALVAGATARADHRGSVKTTVDRELDALGVARERLLSVADALNRLRDQPRFDGYGALAERWRALGELEGDCEALLADRQTSLRNHDDRELCRYVYDELDATHPVLADIASVLNAVRSERQEVEWMLARTT